MKEPLPPVANMLSVAWAGKWEEVDKMNINDMDMDAMFDNVRYVKVQGYFKGESLTYKCMTFTKPIHLEMEKYIQKKW